MRQNIIRTDTPEVIPVNDRARNSGIRQGDLVTHQRWNIHADPGIQENTLNAVEMCNFGTGSISNSGG
jgi:hypothetical protein